MPPIPKKVDIAVGASPPSRRKVTLRIRPYLLHPDGTETLGDFEEREVYAWVYGNSLAVHEDVSRRNDNTTRHAVSALGCGYRVAAFLAESDARRFAEKLLPLDKLFGLKDAQEVERRTPAWVKSWVRACHKASRYLSTAAFREKKE